MAQAWATGALASGSWASNAWVAAAGTGVSSSTGRTRSSLLVYGAFFPARVGRASSGAASFDYYISPTGSNANDGLTTSTPWALSALSSKPAIAGKHVGMMSGTYRVPFVSGDANNNDPLQAIAYGGASAGAPTIIEAVTPLGAIFTTNNGSGVYSVDGASKSTMPVFGLTADNITLKGLKFTDLAWAAVVAAANNAVIDSCEISDIVFSKTAFGVTDTGDNCGGIATLNSKSGLTVNNCYIHDIYNSGTSAGNNNACIGPLYNFTNILITNCTLANSGHGIGSKAQVGKVVAYNNFIYNMQHYAIRSLFDENSLNTPLGGSFHNNLIVGMGNVYGGDNPQPNMLPRNTDFYNNTIVLNSDLTGGGGAIIQWNGPSNVSGVASSNKLYNNVWYVPSAVALPGSNGLFYAATGTNNRFIDRIGLSDYNLYGVNSTKFKMMDSTGTYTTIPTWTTATTFDSHSSIGDPLFLNASGTTPAAFVPQAGSPVLGTGKVGGTSGGAACNMGAWDGTVTAIGSTLAP